MIYDFLIVGQGLAGSILAWQLYQAGAKVLVVDGQLSSASRVAAGLITPVTGKRWVKTSHMDTLLPFACGFYQNLGDQLNRQLYITKPLLRLFQDESDKNKALKRQQDPAYSAYLGDFQPPGSAGYGLNDNVGGLWIRQTGYIASHLLCEAVQHWLVERNLLVREKLAFNQLKKDHDQVQWNAYKAKKIIFCEGWRVAQNPWFQSLPWQPSQGDIITCQSFDPLPPFTVSRGIWLLPLQAGIFRIGATYQWHPLDEKPSQTGKNYLLSQLKQMFQKPIQVDCIEQKTGIRPNTLDQQPIMGCHPGFPQLVLFNGFGSKGGLQIPYYSQCLRDFFLHDQPLPTHVDIERYHDRLAH
ncbi:MAG: hypothetical protein AXA67_11780 [Methylothermaceae bacteria B42]|nr:MAG: hypothetical protein AXA67_11780 [Methylothermaceae bacteria B42]